MTTSAADSGLDSFFVQPSDSGSTPLYATSTPLDSDSTPLYTASSESHGGTGIGEHYWTVDLNCPPGASAALRSFIALAQTAIQTAVDLLGRGTPITPPNVSDLMRPAVYTDLGESAGSVGYQQALGHIQQRQTALLTLDNQVEQTSIVVAASQDQTLQAIEQIVGDLNDTLDSVGGGKLIATQEQTLMWEVSNTVDKVYQDVDSVASQNQQIAGNGSGSGSGAGSASAAGSTSSGGGGDLSSLMQLAMLPIGMAASLAPTVLQMLQKQTDPHKGNGTGQGDGGQSAAPGIPAPVGLPNVAAAVAAPTAPGTPGPAAPASVTGQQNADTTGTATAAPAMMRRRNKRPGITPADNGAAPGQVDTDTETDDGTDADTTAT